jgi:hypothetical protein
LRTRKGPSDSVRRQWLEEAEEVEVAEEAEVAFMQGVIQEGVLHVSYQIAVANRV